jgi:hypothetical protein
VLIGNLNPAIFHPSWFVANDLLSKDSIENAQVEIIHRGICIFKIDQLLRLQVEPNRFVAETREPPFVWLHDLVVRTFKEALIHTPIYKLGINRIVHFSVGDEKTRNEIGKKLAPQKAWGEWATCISGNKEKGHGGMISLVMQETDLDDREIGYINAKVEPSLLIKDNAGIFIEVNDHYEIPKDDSLVGATKIINILEKQFDSSIRRSEWIIHQIMDLKGKV